MKPTPQIIFARALNKRHWEGDCLVSNYSVGSHGYSQIGWREDGRSEMRLVHRVVWEWYFLLPAGRTVDHMCLNRRCSNPVHLRLLPNKVNAADNGNHRKTHCKRGHEFNKENTLMTKNGHRRCRACARAYKAGEF